ncbi:MAG: NAD(+)/NADH kinase [Tidjanibacter sp.]|nr:NAD(+)/NADH kinase [Tidjanibacter sp.]
MKIVIYSRVAHKVSAEEFSAMIEIVTNAGFDYALNRDAARKLYGAEQTVIPEEALYDEITPSLATDSIMLVYGGDGSLLEAARQAVEYGMPVLGVNSGRLGFLTNVPRSEIGKAIEMLSRREYTIERRSLLKVEGDFGRKVYPYALNEFSVQRHHMGMLGIDVEIDGKQTVTYHSDGALIATPTGSTAYSLSAGGPIVAPECGCFVVTPIAPHNLSMRPLVIPDSSTVRIKVDSRESYAMVGLDNQNYTVNSGATFTITRAEKEFFFVKLQNISFYDTLREKMMWGVDTRNA